ncbi:MAG: hypothetical protein LAP87_10675 [Acidobacteriia bacterium]|nr:hypothetical protein [Terriglobia bacterium]
MVSADEPTRGFYDAAARRVVRRDSAVEKAATGLLGEGRPSFYVNPCKNLFYCHGCGRGGDLIRS